MANVIIEYLKKKFSSRTKMNKINNIVSDSEGDMYEPLEKFEWVDNVRKRQETYAGRKY